MVVVFRAKHYKYQNDKLWYRKDLKTDHYLEVPKRQLHFEDHEDWYIRRHNPKRLRGGPPGLSVALLNDSFLRIVKDIFIFVF
jgi:hypothetical protein